MHDEKASEEEYQKTGNYVIKTPYGRGNGFWTDTSDGNRQSK